MSFGHLLCRLNCVDSGGCGCMTPISDGGGAMERSCAFGSYEAEKLDGDKNPALR